MVKDQLCEDMDKEWSYKDLDKDKDHACKNKDWDYRDQDKVQDQACKDRNKDKK